MANFKLTIAICSISELEGMGGKGVFLKNGGISWGTQHGLRARSFSGSSKVNWFRKQIPGITVCECVCTLLFT